MAADGRAGRGAGRSRACGGAGPGGLHHSGEPDRGGELPPGKPFLRVGRDRIRRPDHPGLRDRDEREPRANRGVQGQHGRRRLSHRHLPRRVLRRGRSAQGRHRDAVGVAPAVAARVPDQRHRPRRLRQLGGVGVVARACQRRLRRLHRAPGALDRGASHVLFVVRNDGGTSDLLFQTSDATWQAYNRYGGNSLYQGTGPGGGLAGIGRAYKVSYNRPLTTRDYAPADGFFGSEYPMVRWLERNGYDVSYFSGVDSDARGAEIGRHRAFLSVGHDEYWSKQQRLNVEAARDGLLPGQSLRSPGLLRRQRRVLEDALGAEHQRGLHAPPDAGLLQGDARGRRHRPLARVDGHVARPALRSTPRARTPRTRSPAPSSPSTAAPTRSSSACPTR